MPHQGVMQSAYDRILLRSHSHAFACSVAHTIALFLRLEVLYAGRRRYSNVYSQRPLFPQKAYLLSQSQALVICLWHGRPISIWPETKNLNWQSTEKMTDIHVFRVIVDVIVICLCTDLQLRHAVCWAISATDTKSSCHEGPFSLLMRTVKL